MDLFSAIEQPLAAADHPPRHRYSAPSVVDVESGRSVATPVLTMNLDIVAERLALLRAALPDVTVLYAVKANPAPEIVELLADQGADFDVASPGEIDLCLRLGVGPHRLSYGNTIKKERDIADAVAAGVRRFTVDCAAELAKVLRSTSEGCVFVRLATDGDGADWPLSKKFGCRSDEALALLTAAATAGLQVGLAFHVGSQQRHPIAWHRPLTTVAVLARELAARGHRLAGINLGGGLPSSYLDPVPSAREYGSAINSALSRALGPAHGVDLLIEPGRYLVGDAGVIRSEVVLVTDRSDDFGRRWVYLDVGRFNGLTETWGEAIRYRISTDRDGGPVGPVVLAGPSCDSADVLYETFEYQLPLSLQAGDHVEIHAAGAYTASYASVGFNGFPPLRCEFIRSAGVPGRPV